MIRTIVYWKTKDRNRQTEVKTELGITGVSVNGESEYNGDVDKLKPYIEEGLIVVRMKEYEQEVRRKKVYIHTKQGKSIDSKATRRSSRKRKV